MINSNTLILIRDYKKMFVTLYYTHTNTRFFYKNFVFPNKKEKHFKSKKGQNNKKNYSEMIFCKIYRLSCVFFIQSIWLDLLTTFLKERQYKGYCLISNESDSWKCALDYKNLWVRTVFMTMKPSLFYQEVFNMS